MKTKLTDKEVKKCDSCLYACNNGDYICGNEDSEFFDTIVDEVCELYEDYDE